MVSETRGPSRKGHTKSRTGCRTCKRRHIRCDESLPECHCCRKYNCRCDYLDDSFTIDSMPQNRLQTEAWSPLIYACAEDWDIADELKSSKPSLNTQMPWHNWTVTELRLVHHVSTISHDFRLSGHERYVLWTQEIPLFLSIGASCNFVMSALLAFSASHLEWIAGEPPVSNNAYFHRGQALHGLEEAIGNFSKRNSDTVLAASIILSWESTEWRVWTSLTQGISTITTAMQAWHEESAFADYIRAQKFTSRARRPLDPNGLTGVFPSSELQTPSPNAQSYLSSSWLSTPSPTLRSLSASPNPSGPFNSTLDTECSPLQRKETFNICRSIYEARKHIDPNGELYRQLGEILLFVQNLESVFSNETIEERFDTLQPLRAWLFWIPVSLCEGECIGSDSSLAKLTVLSHLYAMALAIEPSSPGVCGSDLIKRCSSRLEEVDLEITNNFLRSNGSLVHPKTSPRVMACFCCRDEFTVLQSLEESSGSTCNEFCDFRNCQ